MSRGVATDDELSLATQAARQRRWTVWLLLATLAIRATFVLLTRSGLDGDIDAYRALAQNLVAHGVLGQGDAPSAYRPPLYPLMLAALASAGMLNNAAIACLHVALGTATVWLVIVLGQQWKLGRWRFLAGLLLALDPLLLKQSSLVMTETLAALLATAALVGLSAVVERPTARRALLAGALLALGVLCRPVFAPWLAVAPLCLAMLLPTGVPRWRCPALLIVAAAIVLAPWTVRNVWCFGRPIVSTTHGGFTLLLANNPQYYEHLRSAPQLPWDGAEFTRGILAGREISPRGRPDESRNDAREYALAWEYIREQPSLFVRASAYRLSRLWGVLPLSLADEPTAARDARYATALWYTLEFVLALVGCWSLGRQLWRSAWLFGVALVVCVTLVHTVYWTDLRMRAPAMPVVVLVAAAGASWVAVRVARRKASIQSDLRSPN